MATGAEHDAPGIMPFFVYGTLLNEAGGWRRWLQWVNRVERNLIVPGYSLFVTHGAFPYAMKAAENEYVIGELLHPLNDKAAGDMTIAFDDIEGHPHFYKRTEVTVMRSRTEQVKAWMYLMEPSRMIHPEICAPIGCSWIHWTKKNPDHPSDFAAIINSGI